MPSRLAAVALACLCLSAPALAGPIASRSTLQALLGGQGTLETFEAYAIADGNAQVLQDCAVLDAASVCMGQGPGLVGPGLTLRSLVTLSWNGPGWEGAPSKEVLAYDSTSLAIEFTTPAQAAGLDVRTFTDFPVTATLDVFGADLTTLLGSIEVPLPATGAPQFLGWQDEAGIGRITVTQNAWWWSPQIDNVEFGAAVPAPEPASAALLGLGLAVLATRRLTPRG